MMHKVASKRMSSITIVVSIYTDTINTFGFLFKWLTFLEWIQVRQIAQDRNYPMSNLKSLFLQKSSLHDNLLPLSYKDVPPSNVLFIDTRNSF